MDRERHPLASRRTMLRGLAASPIVAVGMSGAVSLAQADPIAPADTTTLGLIERHRAAYAALAAACAAAGPFVRPAAHLMQARDRASAAEIDAFERLVEHEPTTLQGLRCFADYLGQHLEKNGDGDSLSCALATIADACRHLIPAPSA